MKSHKIFYGSSYDRGLFHLLSIWDAILKVYPDATLDCCYGWDLFERAYANNPERMAWKNKMDKLMTQTGITHHGRVGQDRLKEIRSECGIWAYPTDFTEINCHPKGVFVETLEGDKPIEELSLSDVVRTKDGSYKYLTAIRSRIYKGKMVDLKIQCSESLKLTVEHPVLAIKKEAGDGSRSFKKVIKKEAEWVEAGNLQKGDILLASRKLVDNYGLGISIEKYASNKSNNFKKDVNILNTNLTNEKLWWMGYFAGDGNANNRGRVSCLVALKHKDRDLQQVLDGFRAWGLEPEIVQLRGCLEVRAYSYALSRYLKAEFYDGNRQKVLPQQLLSCPQVLDGLLRADGSVNHKYKGNGIQKTFTSKSRKLISQVRTMINLLGYAGKTHKRIHENGATSWYISWVEYLDRKQNFYFTDEEYMYYKLSAVKLEDFEDVVYNIDVDENHTYHANGILVHNCITALESQRDGLVPVVINLAALDETVGSGIKIQGDIYDDEVKTKYLEELIKLMGDEKRLIKESEKGKKFAESYSWEKIANDWIQHF